MTEAIRPQGEIAGDVAAVTPLERVERQIRELKSLPDVVAQSGGGERPAAWAELTETGKLEVLDKLDWQGVTPLERLCVIDGVVDLNRVSPKAQRNYLGDLRHQVVQSIDAERRPTPTAIIANPTAYLTEQQQQPGQEHGRFDEKQGAEEQHGESLLERFERLRDVDGSGLTRAERDLYYYELEGGSAATYKLWKPDVGYSDFPAGYTDVMTFQAGDLENAVDMARESYELVAGDYITDAGGKWFRYDGSTFAHIRQPPEAKLLPSPSDIIANPKAYLPEQGNGHEQDRGQDRGNGR